ncbi:MAG: copper ion binding protein, partial [Thermoproteota archaeon]
MGKKKGVIRIHGMHCASCAQTIEKALKNEVGISSANVNLATEKVVVEYDDGEMSLERISEVIREAGYEPKGIQEEGRETSKIRFKITGMSCASCAKTVERALGSLDGVKTANVNLATEKARVEYFPGRVSPYDLKEAVKGAGYKVEYEEKEEGVGEVKQARRRAIVAWAASIPIIMWMIPEMIFGIVWPSRL